MTRYPIFGLGVRLALFWEYRVVYCLNAGRTWMFCVMLHTEGLFKWVDIMKRLNLDIFEPTYEIEILELCMELSFVKVRDILDFKSCFIVFSYYFLATSDQYFIIEHIPLNNCFNNLLKTCEELGLRTLLNKTKVYHHDLYLDLLVQLFFLTLHWKRRKGIEGLRMDG